MAKQAGIAGMADFGDRELRLLLDEKESEMLKLRSTLDSTNKELEVTRRQLFDKKAQCNEMEEKVTDLTADVGKWKSLANRKGGGGGGGQDHDPKMIQDLEMRIDRLQKDLAYTKKQLEDSEMKRRDSEMKRRDSDANRRPLVNTDHYRVQIKHVQDENTKLTGDILILTDQMEELKLANSELKRSNDNMVYQLQQRGGGGGGGGGRGGSTAGLTDEIEYLRRENDRLARENQSLTDTNMAIHQQAVIYEDDFRREKQEREEANSRFKAAQKEIQELKRQLQERHGSVSSAGSGYQDETFDSPQYTSPHQNHTYHQRQDASDRMVTPNRSYTGYQDEQQRSSGYGYRDQYYGPGEQYQDGNQ